MADAGGEKNLETIRSVVFKESEKLDDKSFTKINGYDFNNGVDLTALLQSMTSTGFQASNLGDAIEVVNQMFVDSDDGGIVVKVKTLVEYLDLRIKFHSLKFFW